MKSFEWTVIVTVLLALYLYACNSHEQGKDDGEETAPVYELDIRNVVDQKDKEFYLSDLTNEIKYIPLETNDSCLLASISKLFVIEEYIFITDRRHLFQFDNSGKFIRQIGSVGKGPGEHDYINNFTIDKFNEEIHVLSRNLMNVYDLESGVFKRSYKIDLEVSDFAVFSQDKIALFTKDIDTKALSSTINEVYLADNNGIMVDSIANPARLNNRSNVAAGVLLYIKQDDLYYLFFLRDALYHIDKDFTKRPYVKFNLDNKIKPEEFYVESGCEGIQLPEHIMIWRVLENQKYIFTTIQKGIAVLVEPNTRYILYDKCSGKLKPTTGFINDLDSGMNFWPRWAFKDNLIEFHEAYQMLDYYKSTKETIDHSESFINLVKGLNEDDNPVLVFVK